MKNLKTALFLGAIAVLTLIWGSTIWAQIDTRRIDDVRSKTILNDPDFRVIDRFMDEAIDEMIRTEDFGNVAKTRAVILSRTSQQAQYAQRFSEAARKQISAGLARAAGLPDQRRFLVTLNLLVLIDNLEDPALTDLAFNYIGAKNAPIRYWAVRIVANPAAAKLVRSNGNSPLGQRISKTIQGLTRDPSPDILGLVIDFATTLGGKPGQDLLLTVADERITQYKKGTVQDELLEVRLLKGLYRYMLTENTDKDVVTQRFVQLFDEAVKRFLQEQDTLSTDQMTKLISVMVEIEDKCIKPLLEQPQNNFKRALENDDLDKVKSEYERLLGTIGALRKL